MCAQNRIEATSSIIIEDHKKKKKPSKSWMIYFDWMSIKVCARWLFWRWNGNSLSRAGWWQSFSFIESFFCVVVFDMIYDKCTFFMTYFSFICDCCLCECGYNAKSSSFFEFFLLSFLIMMDCRWVVIECNGDLLFKLFIFSNMFL